MDIINNFSKMKPFKDSIEYLKAYPSLSKRKLSDININIQKKIIRTIVIMPFLGYYLFSILIITII